MILFESFLIALSTYSAIPVPQFEWNDRNMKYAVCFFPTVGIICGVVLWGWLTFAEHYDISGILFAAVATCLPLLITGGIHMDGYMDTVDALASHQPRARKLEILKDPHCGAFSAIYCGIYLLLQAGLIYELFAAQHILLLCPTFVLSRTFSALCAVNMPNAKNSGMLSAYTKNTEKHSANFFLVCILLISGAFLLWISPMVGGMTIFSAILSVLIYRRMAIKQFGGVTGDTAGFFLQTCELACMTGACIGVHLV